MHSSADSICPSGNYGDFMARRYSIMCSHGIEIGGDLWIFLMMRTARGSPIKLKLATQAMIEELGWGKTA